MVARGSAERAYRLLELPDHGRHRFLMIALGLASLILRWRGRLYAAGWFHRWTVAMGPAGFIALLAGWITTEVGRQPFTVHGLLADRRTRCRRSACPVSPARWRRSSSYTFSSSALASITFSG